MPLLAERGDDRGEIAFAGAGDNIGRIRAVVPHPHVERAVQPERKPALGLVELHRRRAKIEYNTVGRSFRDDRLQIAEALLHQFEPAPSFPDQIGAAGDRALIAIDADHTCARRVQDRARVTAGAEGGIDVDAAVMHREPLDNAAAEHGNMRRR